MARSFRESRFRRSNTEFSEDINPSAYIVNLADCMLVLACGFMVAMIVFWNIDIANVEELKQESLEEIDPQTLPEEMQSGGTYYVEAGTVYMDPTTGTLYMVSNADSVASAASDAQAGNATGEEASDQNVNDTGETTSGTP